MQHLQWLTTGVGPDGVLFEPADKIPSGKSLFIAGSETDSFININPTL